jgi:hypothetical protein
MLLSMQESVWPSMAIASTSFQRLLPLIVKVQDRKYNAHKDVAELTFLMLVINPKVIGLQTLWDPEKEHRLAHAAGCEV